MRGRKADGSWRTPFEPYRQSPAKGDWNDYTEGGAMQYSWHVMWDPEGLVELHGGREKFASRLEKLYSDNTEVPADQKTGECSGTIGQFALGNEHDQHVPYLWQYAGCPDRAAEVVRELCERYFFDTTGGLCGNDDCGQISAWYVFACLGFYSLNPVGGDYVIGAPQLPKITLHLQNGKKFTVIAKNLSRENKYVKSKTLNGKKMEGFILKHSDILNGGQLVFEMSNKKIR
jgi:predicted alpha-1,2-mannosidase